jgi:membrane fusion protein (multidrug efflux system)
MGESPNSNNSSKAALDKAETLLRLAESRAAGARAALGISERALAEATVRAPFAGHLVRRNVSLGEYVQQGTPLVELVSLDPIEVVFHVSEVDSSRVHNGQHVRVTVAPYPGESFDAIVDSVSPTIDPRSRTLRVKGKLENAEGRLRPGLFARADLGVAQRKGVPIVPDQSVLQRTDGSVVFTLTPDDMRVHRRVITIGGFGDGHVEISGGVSPGEFVLTKGHSTLVDGQVVRLPKAVLTESSPAVAAKPAIAEEGAAEVTIQ